ncbi:MAG TPA: hypothetical protein VMB50_20675 [Myxococcales bacterium]|nr:hypothetical protein [Myxococcales bacterium]
MPTAAVAIIAALAWSWLCYELGARRGFAQARAIVAPDLDRLRRAASSDGDRQEHERIQRALLTSIRGGRA